MNAKILVADDSTTIQKFIRMTLSKFDLAIFPATSLVESEAVVKQERPQVLLVDSCLPGVSGAQDINQLRDLAGGVPVIVLVGSFEGTPIEELQAKSLENIIRKPFEPSSLTDLLFSLIDRDGGVVPGASQGEGEDPIGSLGADFSGIPLPNRPISPPRDSVEELIMKNELESNLEVDNITQLIKKTVEEYCDRHFATLAKEVIQAEIRGLIDERSRHSVDN